MVNQRSPRRHKRRGAMIVVFAFILVVFVSMAAVAVDFGWIALAKNQLQVSADAAAMAGAGQLLVSQDAARQAAFEYIGLNPVGSVGQTGTASDPDVVLGHWDRPTDVFTAVDAGANALKVTVHKQLPLFFAPLLGVPSVNLRASAVGVAGPRDIAFVIDLSGSMNNDTEIWATNAINSRFPSNPTIGTDIMAMVFTDFGYGAYPGTRVHVGQGLSGAPNNDNSYTWLANTYLLNNNSVAAQYRTLTTDSNSVRKTKTYSWIIDNQLATNMPLARPTPNSSNATSAAYWRAYLDFIIKPVGGLPPNPNTFRISTAGNPYLDAWPTLNSSSYSGFYNKLGYQTYVQFMMDYGREKAVTGSTYTPLSILSPDVPLILDTDPASPGYNLRFPPREQPTHAVRLALMAAIDKIATINSGRSEGLKDHVSVITFDTAAGSTVRYPLSTGSCDYAAIKNAVRTLQATSDSAASTASENGLILAKNHLDSATNPSGARAIAHKFVIFLSDGLPNLKQSPDSDISAFASAHPSSEWYTTGSYHFERDATIMQTWDMQLRGWKVYSVGVGLGADRGLLDRMARLGETGITDPSNPTGPKIGYYASGNPGDYQAALTSIFSTILSIPVLQIGM